MSAKEIDPGFVRTCARVGWILIALVMAAAAAILVRSGSRPVPVEVEWLEGLQSVRSPFLTSAALLLDQLGGSLWSGIVIPALLIVTLLVMRRFRDAGVAVAALLSSVAAVQLLKHVVGRERPPNMMVASDVGSFPSGHVANAATLVVIFTFVFRRVWIGLLGVGYVVVMSLSRCYLLVHWPSDTVCGALLGSSIAVAMWWALDYRHR